MSALSTLSPRIKHSALALTLTGEMMTNYVRALSVIAANPGATNKCVSEIINRPQGSMGLPCRAARATLSISDSRGASDATIEDYDKYAGVCSVLGVTPCEGTTFRKVHTVEAVPVVNLEAAQPDPLAELRRHAIAPVHELPGVGANLHDHPYLYLAAHLRRDAMHGGAR